MAIYRNCLLAAVIGFSSVALAGCTTGPNQSTTSEYVSDSVITAKVKAAIFDDPTLKVAEINVETFKGVVQLSGFVTSGAAAERAVYVASQVDGVRSVKNDMRLK